MYEMTLNIGKTRDGRNILYDINKIKRIDNGNVPSNVASLNINPPTSIVSDNSKKSSTKYSISNDGRLISPKGEAMTLETSEVGNYGTLMAIRNIDEAELSGMLELNGIPVPSIAITDE